MKQALYRVFPLATVIATIALAVLLLVGVIQPFGAGGEADSSSIRHRLCNTVVDAPPAGPNALSIARHVEVEVEVEDDVVQAVELTPMLEVWLRVPGQERAEVSIDPIEAVVTAGQTVPSEMLPTLETVRRQELNRSRAPWPYTDKGRPTERVQNVGFRYLDPHPASGILVWWGYADGDRWSANLLKVANCQSFMSIMAEFPEGAEETEAVADMRFVQPEDEAAFEAFFQGVDPRVTLGPPLEP